MTSARTLPTYEITVDTLKDLIEEYLRRSHFIADDEDVQIKLMENSITVPMTLTLKKVREVVATRRK